MKYIVKHPAPQAFENWKKQENPITWDDFPSNLPQNQEDGIVYYSKNELRERLLDEQGYICCYCQQEIKNDFHTVVEHLVPREVFLNLTFEYDNLLASCDGGQQKRQKQRLFPSFCDSNKCSEQIEISPLDKDCEEKFDYFLIEDDDKIEIGIIGKSEEAQKVINILNLDNSILRKKRGDVLSPYLDETLTIDEIKEIHDSFQSEIISKPNNTFPAFCVVVINILGKLI